MGPCTNKTGHNNNNFVVVSPCWRQIKASGVRPLWLCFGIHWTAYWVFPEKFTFLSEISPPRHQDCICSDLSQTWARLWRAQRSPLLYHQQRNTWLLQKIPSFYDSYATTCSACSHIRVSGESLNKAALFAVCPFAMISHKGPCLQLSPAWLPASFKLCELMPAQGVLLSPQVSQQGEVKVVMSQQGTPCSWPPGWGCSGSVWLFRHLQAQQVAKFAQLKSHSLAAQRKVLAGAEALISLSLCNVRDLHQPDLSSGLSDRTLS